MSPLQLTVLWIAAIVFIAIAILIIISRRTPKKWESLYNYLQLMLFEVDDETAEDVTYRTLVRNNITTMFDLTIHQADDCMVHWNNKKWFKEQPWLEIPYEKIH